jgi:hypothetical protein
MTKAQNVARVQRWQHRRRANGQCVKCSLPSGRDFYCEACRERTRESNRARYRAAHGIPLDAPLDRRGRPRIGAHGAA